MRDWILQCHYKFFQFYLCHTFHLMYAISFLLHSSQYALYRTNELFVAGMILRNHSYLKVYKCWWILRILKTPTIKWLGIFFKKYFNFQGFYIVYIIIGDFLGEKIVPHQNWVKQGFKKCKMVHLFWEKHGKIAHWAKIRP